MLDIVTIGTESGEETLRRKAGAVTNFDADLKGLIAEMHEAMRRGRGIGLAGPQVDKALRLFVTHVDDDEPRVFINPELLLTSNEEVDYEEGCLSIPGLYTQIRRPEFVKIQAFNERGRPFTMEASGLLARVILHENDHLEGVLFIDRLSAAKRERVLATWLKKIRM